MSLTDDADRVRTAIRQGLDRLDAKDEIEVFDRMVKDVVHLEVSAKAFLGKLKAEKMCGMTHSEEIDLWYATELRRQERA